MINDNTLNNLLRGKKTWKLRENEISDDLETQMNIDRVKPCLSDISAFLEVPLHITKPKTIGSEVQYAIGYDSDYVYRILIGPDEKIRIRIDFADDYYDGGFFAECENIDDLGTWDINRYGASARSGECLYNARNVREITAAMKYYSRHAREQEEFEEAHQARKRRIAKRALIEKRKKSEKLLKALKEKRYRRYREEVINSLSAEDIKRIDAEIEALKQQKKDAERYRDICEKNKWWSTYRKQFNKVVALQRQINDLLGPVEEQRRAAREKAEEEAKKAKEEELKVFDGKRIYSAMTPDSGFMDPPAYYQYVEGRDDQQLVRKIAQKTVSETGFTQYHGQDFVFFPVPDEFEGEPIPLSELRGIKEFNPRDGKTWIHWNYYTD